MSVTFACGQCGKTFTVDDKFAGKKGKCKQCGAVMQIPATPVAAVSPKVNQPSAVPRESSPTKRPPASPATTPAHDVFGFEDDARPQLSALINEADDGTEELEPSIAALPGSRSSNAYQPPRQFEPPRKKKKKKQQSGEESAFFLIGRVILGLVIGSAGCYASMGLYQKVLKTAIPNLSSKDEIEGLIKERIALNRELSALLDSLDDVPAAQAASATANQKVRAIAANLHKLATAKGFKNEILPLNKRYEGEMNQATEGLLQSILKFREKSLVFQALSVGPAFAELDREEQNYLRSQGLPTTTPTAPLANPFTPPVRPPTINPPAQPPRAPNFPTPPNRPGRPRMGPRNGSGGPI